MSNTISIIGAGGFARELYYELTDHAKFSLDNPINFLVDNPEEANKSYINNPIPPFKSYNNNYIIPKILDINNKDNFLQSFLLGIGDPRLKKYFLSKINIETCYPENLATYNNRHPLCWGKGNIICRGSILTTNIKLSNYVLINLDCTIGHDVTIEDYCTLSPGVHVSGNVHIKEGVEIGTGANIIPGVTIGEWSVIGAGATVTKDIPPYSLAVGLPAKVVKTLDK